MVIKFISIFKNHITSALEISLLKRKKNVKKTSRIMIFIIRFFYSIPLIRNLIKSNNISNIKDDIFFEKLLFSKDIVQKIVGDGYFFSKIKKDKIDIINQEFEKNYFSYRYKDPNKNYVEQINKNLNLSEIINESLEKKIPHLTIDIDQSKKCLINEIGRSNFFLAIAKNYLNREKITLHTYCYISNPIKTSSIEQKKNAQYFHYDCDYRKFLKIFVYLNNVYDDAGPHTFVKGTHKKREIIHLNANRLDDEEINKYYDSKIIKFTGDAGSIIFEDTFGLHKGHMPEEKSRAMLVYEYGISPKIFYDGTEIET